MSKCTSLQILESSWVHLSHLIEVKLIEYMHVTSLNWSFLRSYISLTELKLQYFNSVYWSFLRICSSIHCIEAFWVHVPHLTVFLFLIKYTLHHCIESFWVHVLYNTALNLLKYMHLTSLYWNIFHSFTSLQSF